MLDFEKEFPYIAKKYFDLKFEEQNVYKYQYGYGRKYKNKPLCNICKVKGYCWDNIIEQKGNYEIEKKFIELYFNKEIDILCLKYDISECHTKKDEIAQYIMYILKKYSINEIVDFLKEYPTSE